MKPSPDAIPIPVPAPSPTANGHLMSSAAPLRQVHLEAVIQDRSPLDPQSARSAILEAASRPGAVMSDLTESHWPHLESVRAWEGQERASPSLSLKKCNLHVYAFKLDRLGGQAEEMEAEPGDGGDAGGGGGSGVNAALHWMLPSAELQGLWESLVFDRSVKDNLLKYVKTTLRLSDLGVDPNLVSWNRVVLLHGPPGTGKTSLCRALAQKLAVRLSDRYRYGQLIEVNSHSLFSKWFSESGKLVQKMFDTIQEIVDDPEAFVCVLIDEVESLAAVRKASGSEPSDAIRVVNALLTQLDKLKNYANVLLLTTSNITGSIDLAFVDRADLKMHIGLPSKEAIYTMLHGSTTELIEKNLFGCSSHYLLPYRKLTQECFSVGGGGSGSQENNRQPLSPPVNGSSSSEAAADPFVAHSKKLLEIAAECVQLSGRTIRKVPFLALVRMEEGRPTTLADFLECLGAVVAEQHSDKQQFNQEN